MSSSTLRKREFERLFTFLFKLFLLFLVHIDVHLNEIFVLSILLTQSISKFHFLERAKDTLSEVEINTNEFHSFQWCKVTLTPVT